MINNFQMKDNFSKQAEVYAKFRPSYPKPLFDFIFSLVSNTEKAWDCGTGNGQVAIKLANYFEKVYATDISENQLKNAVQKENIIYKKESAEKTSFPDNIFDLITVAQAIHWFDFEAFYKEVERTLKPGGILAVIGYNMIKIDAETDKIVSDFYLNITGPYWDKERKYIDEEYKTIPFPYKDLGTADFTSEYEWELPQLIGFLDSWSAVQHFKDKNNNQNPVDLIINDLKKSWPDGIKKKVTFPILLRIGRKENFQVKI
jgi:ubiquinone/menaquinone biosynthesis C-methylase UbiE